MIETIKISKDGSKKMKFNNCEFWVNPFGAIMWAEDWGVIIKDLVEAGLAKEEHSVFNHTHQVIA